MTRRSTTQTHKLAKCTRRVNGHQRGVLFSSTGTRSDGPDAVRQASSRSPAAHRGLQGSELTPQSSHSPRGRCVHPSSTNPWALLPRSHIQPRKPPKSGELGHSAAHGSFAPLFLKVPTPGRAPQLSQTPPPSPTKGHPTENP